jgi:hypothetical protein
MGDGRDPVVGISGDEARRCADPNVSWPLEQCSKHQRWRA